MNINSNKIKSWIKENKTDFFYGLATVLILILTIAVFSWATQIILNVFNVNFSNTRKDAQLRTSSFNLKDFEKISSRINSIEMQSAATATATTTSQKR